MVQTKVGRYWEQAKRWFFRKVWSFQTKEGCQTKVSKMRPTCQSHTDDDSQRASAVRRKEQQVIQGPKPTNVRTFAKRKSMSMGGLV